MNRIIVRPWPLTVGMLPQDAPFRNHAYDILTDDEWFLYVRRHPSDDDSRTFEDSDIPDTFELPENNKPENHDWVAEDFEAMKKGLVVD